MEKKLMCAWAVIHVLCSCDSSFCADVVRRESVFLNDGKSSLPGTGRDFQVWLQNKSHAAGFLGIGNGAFTFSVVDISSSGAGQTTLDLLWTANKAIPVSRNATIGLEKDGNLTLRESNGSVVWSSLSRTNSASMVQLESTGNLVLMAENSEVVWQSFDYSTNNTFLQAQTSRNVSSDRTSHRKDPFPPGIFVVGMSVLAVVGAVAIGLSAFAWIMKHKLRKRYGASPGALSLDDIPGLPPRYSYKDLRAATGGFQKKLGTGILGTTYEGVLPDGTKVVVRILDRVKQESEEGLLTELASIGGIQHPNLVRLLGYCLEDAHAALVYDYMVNGSLDKCLFQVHQQHYILDWDSRFKIALGTAQGLAFLHEGCEERILHGNLKPENILLDEHLTAKVADYGISSLLKEHEENRKMLMTTRGANGYLAPEWLVENPVITDKSDVYCFGIILLEIVCGRSIFDASAGPDKAYLPVWASFQAQQGGVAELRDPRLSQLISSNGEHQLRRCVEIALWCLQEDPALRPSMKYVEQMLIGSVHVPASPPSHEFALEVQARLLEESKGILKAAFISALRASKKLASILDSPSGPLSPRKRQSLDSQSLRVSQDFPPHRLSHDFQPHH